MNDPSTRIAQNYYQLSSWDVRAIVELVLVSGFASSLDENAIVGSHATVHHADVVGDLLNLEGRVLFVQQ